LTGVTVIMPTYNDEKYIEESLNSCLRQKGVNVQIILVDDGSTDKTQDICLNICQNHSNVIYIRQKNKGQLNAILTATRYVKGSFVTLLHSDDRIFSEWSYFTNIQKIKELNCQGVYSDLLIMNKNGQITGLSKSERLDKYSLIKLLWLLGSNFIADPFFVTKDFYFKNIVKTYVTWNMPYWLIIGRDKIELANLIYVEQPWYVYRVYDENYIRSNVGKFEAFSGCARTILTLSEYFDLEFMVNPEQSYVNGSNNLGKILIRRKSKMIHDEHFYSQVRTLYGSLMDKYEIIPSDLLYYQALLNFYSGHLRRNFEITYPVTDVLYTGKDSRIFYNHLSDSSNSIYKQLLVESFNGPFDIVTIPKNYKKIQLICKFLNISSEVKISY